MSDILQAIPQAASVDDAQALSVQRAGAEARDLLRQMTEALGPPAAGSAGPLTRFFPNGVELLYLKVEVSISAAAKASIEFKLAGPKPQAG